MHLTKHEIIKLKSLVCINSYIYSDQRLVQIREKIKSLDLGFYIEGADDEEIDLLLTTDEIESLLRIFDKKVVYKSKESPYYSIYQKIKISNKKEE